MFWSRVTSIYKKAKVFRGCIEGIDLFKLFHLAKVTPRRRAPCRISMPRPPFGRDRCLRLLKAINTKNEITFGRTYFVNRRIAEPGESDLILYYKINEENRRIEINPDERRGDFCKKQVKTQK